MYNSIIHSLSSETIFDYSGIFPRSFDIIIYGNSILYALGVLKVIQKLQRTGDIRIHHFFGHGYCSILQILFCCNVPITDIFTFFISKNFPCRI